MAVRHSPFNPPTYFSVYVRWCTSGNMPCIPREMSGRGWDQVYGHRASGISRAPQKFLLKGIGNTKTKEQIKSWLCIRKSMNFSLFDTWKDTKKCRNFNLNILNWSYMKSLILKGFDAHARYVYPRNRAQLQPWSCTRFWLLVMVLSTDHSD